MISALAFQATVSFITGNWDDAAPGLEAGLLLGQEQGNRVLVNQWNGCERGRGDPAPLDGMCGVVLVRGIFGCCASGGEPLSDRVPAGHRSGSGEALSAGADH